MYCEKYCSCYDRYVAQAITASRRSYKYVFVRTITCMQPVEYEWLPAAALENINSHDPKWGLLRYIGNLATRV